MAGREFHPGDRGCLLSVYAENLGLVLMVVANLIGPGADNRFRAKAPPLVASELAHLLGVLCRFFKPKISSIG
jgi:hypothetical protein